MTNAISQARSADDVRRWLVDTLAERLQIDPDGIDRHASLVSLGVDSMQFVVLVGELEDWLGCRFIGNPLVQFPSIHELSEFIARELAAGKTVIDPATSIDVQ